MTDPLPRNLEGAVSHYFSITLKKLKIVCFKASPKKWASFITKDYITALKQFILARMEID